MEINTSGIRVLMKVKINIANIMIIISKLLRKKENHKIKNLIKVTINI